jgi:class I fructose-bisphosphate aldolase
MSILKNKTNLKKITRKGKAMFLAYDQGMEHGPTDFNDKNIDPLYIIKIAKDGNFTGLIFGKGIAEKYNQEIKDSKIPLIVKLNGKTSLVKGDPVSKQLCTVEEAYNLGAAAVGYTIYIGSEHEEEMMQEFVKIQREAHKRGLPAITWIYPRGKALEGKSDADLLAYSARVGLEIGADIIKIHSHGNKEDLKWAVKAAGKAKVVIAGGSKKGGDELTNEIKDAMKVGCAGVAIGRNIWQAGKPIEVTNKIKKIIFGK